MFGNVVELIVKAQDQASAVVTGAIRKMQAATHAYTNTMHSFNGAVNSSVQSLLLLGGGTVGISRLKTAFESALETVDDFKLATIGIAATLTDSVKGTDAELKQVYEVNKQYAEETFQKVELAASRFFASGKEMVEGWQILTQKGVKITSDDDINNLGIIVDRIKLATQGQASSMQIAQELRAVLSGHARATDQIAMLLKDRLGPEWEKQLKAAQKQGKALEFVAGQFAGLGAASEDVGRTLESQRSTLSTLVTQIGRGGLAGAYDDVVNLVAQINSYLMLHRDELIAGISQGWDTIKQQIIAIRDFANEQPLLASIVGDAASVIATFLIGTTALRKGLDFVVWLFAQFVANWKYFGTLVKGIATGIYGLAAAFGPVGIAVAAVIALIATLSLAKWIGEWEVAGLKVKEYVEFAKLWVENLGLYVKNFFLSVLTVSAHEAWEAVANITESAIDAMKRKLDEFATWATKWVPNLDPFSQDEVPSSPPVNDPNDPAHRQRDARMILLQKQQETAAQIELNKRYMESYLLEQRLNNLSEEEKARYHAEADYLSGDPPKSTKPITGPGPKGGTDDSGAAAKAAKDRARLAEEMAQYETALAEAQSKQKIALLESEQSALERSYKAGATTAEDYYAGLKRIAVETTDVKLAQIEAEKQALLKSVAEQKAAAKTPDQARTVELKIAAKIVDLDAEMGKLKTELADQLANIDADYKASVRERLDAEVSALQEILQAEGTTVQQRAAINQQYLDKRIEQIRQEANELKQKGIDAVLVEQWVAAKIREAQMSLRGYNLAELQNMLHDTATTAAEKEQIWRELQERIEAGEVDTWTAFKLGWQNTVEHFNNHAQTMLDAGQQLAEGLRDGFKSVFLSSMRGDISDLSDWWTSFGESMQDLWAQWLSDMLMKWLGFSQALQTTSSGSGLLGWLTGLFGGSSTTLTSAGGVSWSSGLNFLEHHTGGVVGEASARSRHMPSWLLSFAPRLHSGLAADEFPAILQRGEQVIAKKDVGKTGASLNTVINVHMPAGGSGGMDPAAAKYVGSIVAAQVRAEFNKNLTEQLRPGGILNRRVS